MYSFVKVSGITSRNGGQVKNGAVVDAQGNLYVTDQGAGTIFKGQNIVVSGLGSPQDITIDHNGNLIVADQGNNVIYLINPNNNYAVTVLAGGNGGNQAGYQDGSAFTALFNHPTGVKVDAQGNIWVADQGNKAIRKIILQ